MLIKDIVETDTINYKDISMFIIFPTCSFKCGKDICQNSNVVKMPNIEISVENILYKYLSNPLNNALICGGLEPFDSWEDLYALITHFRIITDDDIVIYTGYNYDEIKEQINTLKYYKNIIVKFGRFIPNQPHHYDEILGVELSSPNQYAKRIS